jgi:arylformamidase
MGKTIVDLSHKLSATIPQGSVAPAMECKRSIGIELQSTQLDGSRYRVDLTEIKMSVHTGTHIDAPNHFVIGALAISEIPLERFIGRTHVLRVPTEAGEEIGPDRLAGTSADIEPGDIVLINTGWWQRFMTDAASYCREHPWLSAEAGDWLAARGVKMLGIDTINPDISPLHRPAAFDWPVHCRLLAAGIPVMENVNYAGLAGNDAPAMTFWLNAAPISIDEADGAPVRAVAYV